jgi:hypothetical protein
VTKPRNDGALNRKLQKLCRRVGLLEHNTFYVFRRAAASENINAHDTEAAQALLGHNLADKVTRVHYDPVGMGRYDLTALRIQSETLSPDEVEKFFRQSHLALYIDTELSRVDELKRRTDGETR